MNERGGEWMRAAPESELGWGRRMEGGKEGREERGMRADEIVVRG